VIIDIEDYKRLSCARQVGLLFLSDQIVQEALHRIARKASVNIPVSEEADYGLYLEGHLLEYDKTLESYGLPQKGNLLLRRRKEEEVSLVILIEDYVQLQSARKTSSTFRRDQTVGDALYKIARKGTVCILHVCLSR
jgi:hypothetical protein